MVASVVATKQQKIVADQTVSPSYSQLIKIIKPDLPIYDFIILKSLGSPKFRMAAPYHEVTKTIW